MAEFISFFIKHAPFWTLPSIVIFGDFAYIFWLKDHRLLAGIFSAVVAMSFLVLAFYIIAGGPNLAVKVFEDAVFSK
jgi:ABC-type phosphate transport system permease subunit